MKDSDNISLASIFGLAAGAFLIAMGATFFARRVYAMTKLKLKETSILDEAILNCQIQDENQISDLVIIKDALAIYNQETRFLIQKINTHKAYESVKKYSYFQSTPEDASIEFIDKSEHAQMLRLCYELMDSYPSASFDDSLTVEAIHCYYEATEAHHQKVLNLAECLLPDLSSLLNEVKIRTTQSL